MIQQDIQELAGESAIQCEHKDQGNRLFPNDPRMKKADFVLDILCSSTDKLQFIWEFLQLIGEDGDTRELSSTCCRGLALTIREINENLMQAFEVGSMQGSKLPASYDTI